MGSRHQAVAQKMLGCRYIALCRFLMPAAGLSRIHSPPPAELEKQSNRELRQRVFLIPGIFKIFYVGFFLVMRSVLRNLAATNDLVLRFGLSAGYDALLIIPTLAAVLTVVLVIFAVLAWVWGYWSLLGRVFFSLVTLAALVLTGLMVYWELLVLPL